MQENMIKTILLATNLCLWASGWAVLAAGVHMMSGENGRHYAAILLGKFKQTMQLMDAEEGRIAENGGNTGEILLTSKTLKNNALASESPGHLTNSPAHNNSSWANSSLYEAINATESQDALDVKLEVTLLVLGSVVVMAGLVGCIAASQNDRTLLLAYCLLMIAVGLGDGGAGIWCFYSASQNINEVSSQSSSPALSSTPFTKGNIDDPLQRLHQWYGSSEHVAYTEALNAVQEQLSCCGISGPNDYVMSYWHHVYFPGKTILPSSCCSQNISSTATQTSTLDIQCEDASTSVHHKGCLEILPSMISSDFLMMGNILFVISILQISGASATLMLRNKIKTMTCGEVPALETLLF